MALVWLLVGLGMLAVAFVSQVPTPEYVKLLAEKVLLERQHQPHEHLNPDAIEKFRPAWKNPIFFFGIGAIVLAGVQVAINLDEARRARQAASTP